MSETASGVQETGEFWGVSTDAWQAIGSIATAGAFIIAACAVLVAFLQLRSAQATAAAQLGQAREAAAAQLQQNQDAANAQMDQSRRLAAQQLKQDRIALRDQLAQTAEAAKDQTRPYVLLSAQIGDQTFAAIDLVLENAGQTAARDVVLTVDPPFVRSGEDADSRMQEARIFERPVAMLPPAYRVVSYLDSAIDRHRATEELPSEHRVTISYHDGRGNEYTDESIVDLTLWDGLLFGQRYGLHEAAKALQAIEKLLSKSPVMKRELEVVVEDRASRDERIREQHTRQRERHEAMVARQQAARDAAAAATVTEDPPEQQSQGD